MVIFKQHLNAVQKFVFAGKVDYNAVLLSGRPDSRVRTRMSIRKLVPILTQLISEDGSRLSQSQGIS